MNVFLTYDYELCLGRKTGTPDGCLFQPMLALSSMFKRNGVRVNIFVDAAYLLRLNELRIGNPNIQKDYDEVLKNIDLLSLMGHSIQFHFHPQWINAQYCNGEWFLDNDHYKLSDFPLEVQRKKLANHILWFPKKMLTSNLQFLI